MRELGLGVIITLVSVSGAYAECEEGANSILLEVRQDGGVEYETLEELYETCLSELQMGLISRDAETMVSEIGSYLDSWDALLRMSNVPPASMKEEMIQKYPHIASMLQRDLQKLLDRI